MEEPKGRKRGKAEIRQALAEEREQSEKDRKALEDATKRAEDLREPKPVEPEAQPSTEDAPIETPDPVEASATPDTTTTTPITPVVESPRRTDTMASAFERAEKDREGRKEFHSEKEVASFVDEFGLKDILPLGFSDLHKDTQYAVIQQLKQRIVDIVKSDAQTQYSEDLRQRLTSTTSKLLDGNKGKKFLGKITVGVKKLGKSVGGRLAKESRVKDFETKTFKGLQETAEGKKLVAENLSLLTTRMKNQEVSVGPDGKTRINFIKTEDIPDISPAQTERLQEFNEAASRFAEKPYEWGLEKSGKHRKAYDDAKFEYEKTRNEVLTIMQSKEKTGEDTATANMLRVENSLKMEQLLNTHPEVEKALADLSKDGTFRDKAQRTVIDLLKGAVGEKGERAWLAAGGAGLRMLAKGAAVFTASTGLTFIAAPIIGGAIGRIRGGMRAKETLEKRTVEGRRGKKTSIREGASASTDATRMADRLEKLIKEIATASGPEKAKKIALLKIRIDHTVGKIEKGEVNFGDAKSALVSQFNLTNKLNEALVLNTATSKEIDREVSDEIKKLLKIKAGQVETSVSARQQEYIAKQMRNGMLMGAGFATAGYLARWMGEELGWWGGGAENVAEKTPASSLPKSGVMDRTHLNTQGDTAKANLEKLFSSQKPSVDATRVDAIPKVTHDSLRTDSMPGAPKDSVIADALAKEKADAAIRALGAKPDSAHVDSLTHNAQDSVVVKPNTSSIVKPNIPVEAAPQMPATPASGAIELEQNAIIGKGEGIESAFIRQIKSDPEIAKALGFKGDVSDTRALNAFAGRAAHKLAIDNGYVNGPGGSEVWIKEPGKVAYQIETDATGKVTVLERAVSDGKLVEEFEKHSGGETFEKDLEKYEYHHGSPVGKTAEEQMTMDELKAKIDAHLASKPLEPLEVRDMTPGTEIKMPDELMPKPSTAGVEELATQTQKEMNVYYGPDGVRPIPTTITNLGNGNVIAAMEDRTTSPPISIEMFSSRQASQVYESNFEKMFDENVRDQMQVLLKQTSVQDLLETSVDSARNESMGNLSAYVHKLQELTGLAPKGKTFGIFGRNESTEDYIKRALLRMAEIGQLDKVKL